MRTLRWLFVGVTCALLAAPMPSMAQDKGELKKEATSLNDIIGKLLTPYWDISLHGGLSSNGRFLLQRPLEAPFAERVLTSNTGWSIGASAGMEVLQLMGVRLDYTFASSDLRYRTDNGNNSRLFDIDDVGKIKNHIASVEVIRYLLPARSHVAPYFSLGVLGSWWVLGEENNLVVPLVIDGEGSTEFRTGGLATIGVRANVGHKFDVRLEAQKNSIKSPFTGRSSFLALAGTTIDEPTRVSQNNVRLIATYHFSRKAERGSAANKE
jgi:hypothetical protein